MKPLFTLTCLLAFALTIFAQDANPYSVWCDYHSTYFYKKKQEYPNGTCYDVYSHTKYDYQTKKTTVHTMRMKCAK